METESIQLPENFVATINDFTKDLTTTFPEYAFLWKKWESPQISVSDARDLFIHCLGVFPERFFDILNQNVDIFNKEGSVNTVFLPNVDFKILYHCGGVSDKTRQTLWKYLQLILFMLVGSVKDKMDFGDAMNMFQNMDETDLQDKLKTTISSMGDFFSQFSGDATFGGDTEGGNESVPEEEAESRETGFKLPKPEDLHEKLKGLFNGKIGTLAREIAEDIGGDIANVLGEDMSDVKSTQDILSKLMKNPEKINGIVKTVGQKLEQKMKAGDITQEEMMKEAQELMKQMANGVGGAGGAGGMADMFKTMAKTMGLNIPKGARMDTNAFTQLEKKMSTKDKLRARMEQKKQKIALEKAVEAAKMAKQHEDYQRMMATNPNIFTTDDPANFVFRMGDEKQEKSSILPLTAAQKKRQKQKAKKQAEKTATENKEIGVEM